MIKDFFDSIINLFNSFDLIVIILIIYSVIQCSIKGFSASFISFKMDRSIDNDNYHNAELQPCIRVY